MAAQVLVYAAAGVVAAWGVSHLVPTRAVVAGFGRISLDNRRVLTMEWVAEGLALVFVGALVAAVTLSVGADDRAAVLVYRLAAALLGAIAILTTFTGARTPVGWFKACPLVLASAVALLLVGSAL